MRIRLLIIFEFAFCLSMFAQTGKEIQMGNSSTIGNFHYNKLSLQYDAGGVGNFYDNPNVFLDIEPLEPSQWGVVNSPFVMEDYSYGESRQLSDHWYMHGAHSYDFYYGMGAMRSAQVGWAYVPNEKWRFDLSVSAAKYVFDAGMGNRFAVSGLLSYSFNDYVSAYLFGSYTPSYNFYSPAMMPYLGYSNFGGAFSFANEYVGVDVGMKRYLDPFSGRWETQPIVMPFVNVNGQKMGFDVGRLLQDVFRSFLFNASQKELPSPPDFHVKGAPVPNKTALTPGRRF